MGQMGTHWNSNKVTTVAETMPTTRGHRAEGAMSPYWRVAAVQPAARMRCSSGEARSQVSSQASTCTTGVLSSGSTASEWNQAKVVRLHPLPRPSGVQAKADDLKRLRAEGDPQRQPGRRHSEEPLL